jgi:hypothetical protein
VDQWLGGDEYALDAEVSFSKYNAFFRRKNISICFQNNLMGYIE